MNQNRLDCTCFSLPAPDNLRLLCLHPAHMYLQVKRAVIERPVTSCISVRKKTDEDKQHNDFAEIFYRRWAAKRFHYKDDLPIEQKQIGQYQVFLVPEFDEAAHDFILSAGIDLDENYYLYASAGYYIDKSYTIFNEISLEDKALSIFTKEENLEAYSKIFARLQEIKQAVVSDAYNYLFSLLENLKLLGDYERAMQMQPEQPLRNSIRPDHPDAIVIEEKHFSLIQPRYLIEDFYGSSKRRAFYGGTDKAIAQFELEHGKGRLEAELRSRPQSSRQHAFDDFFHDYIFYRWYQKSTLMPMKTLVIDNHLAKLACSLRPDGCLSFIGAIEPYDEDHICCLEFEARYDVDENALVESNEKEITSALAFHPPFTAKAKALAEVYDYLFAVFSSLHIKDEVIQQSKRQAYIEQRKEEDSWKARKRWHKKNYTGIRAQKADPFHARHYPDQFAKLENQLNNYPDLPLIDRKGIYTNARLAIGFMPTEVDDYSQKGNTRFFGVPDLPPGVDYPKYDPEAESAASKEGTLCKFFAQINFADIKGLQDYLPDSGILYLFIDSLADSEFAYGNVLDPRMVFYYDGDIDLLQSAKELNIQPSYIYDVHNGYEDEESAQPARVKPFSYVNILDTVEEWDAMDYPPKLYNVPVGAINNALIAQTSFSVIHSMNAHVAHVYNQNIEVNGEHVTSPYVEAAKVLGGKPDDYVVLLCLGWDNQVSGFMFGDAGYAYFMIAKEKLKKRDFSQIYYNATSY